MGKSIKVNVTNDGVVVPRDMLGNAKTVEITMAGHGVLIVSNDPPGIHRLGKSLENISLSPALLQKDDPALKMGQNPVDCGVEDGSVRHDDYLYGNLP